MGTSRLRLFAVLIGALLVAATFTYPSWRPEPVERKDETEFPGLAADFQAGFKGLPAREQSIYLDMYEDDSMMAIDLLTARLTPTPDCTAQFSNDDTKLPDWLAIAIRPAGGYGATICAQSRTGVDTMPCPLGPASMTPSSSACSIASSSL